MMKCKKCKKDIPSKSVFCLHCGQNQSVTPRASRTRANGTGSAFKVGKVWKAEVTFGYTYNSDTGKRHAIRKSRSGFKTKTEALEYLPILLGNTEVDPAETLKSLWEGYSTGPMLTLSKSSQGKHQRAYSKLKNISKIPISGISITNLQEQIDLLAPSFYPAREMRDILSHLYKRAVAQGDVHANLAEFIILPANEKRKVVPFDNTQLLQLWEDYESGQKFTGYVLLMIYSAMMPGELFQAEKEMINWENQLIVGSGLKTEIRKETPIVIADLILPVLKDLCAYSKSEMVLDVSQDSFYTLFTETMRRLQINDKVPYDCRHTTATALALVGVPIEEIKLVMRHTDIKTTRQYIHIDPDTKPLLKAVNRITTKLKTS